jgi:hypothetical protein
VFSDASGSFGCGAYDPAAGWFHLQWPATWGSANIATKDMVPVVVAAAVWGRAWTGWHICFHSDNMVVVAALQKRAAKDPSFVHYLHCLFFYCTFYGFKFTYLAPLIQWQMHSLVTIFSFSPTDSTDGRVTCHREPSPYGLTSLTWTRQFTLSLARQSPQTPLVPTSQP